MSDQEQRNEKYPPGHSYIEEKPLPETPYHVFTLAKKKKLVYIVSAAGIFSPLSSNIYFPALGRIATELNVSISLVGLTITVYMVVQGIAPSFWGPYSDTIGRRPVFVGTFIVYLISNIGLALSKNFITLMIFRGVQAAGSAATISIGAGVIGDITTPSERGQLIGIFGGLRMMGQSIGPVLGAILTQFFGFHAIFWFLLILGALSLTSILLLLPETLRSIAGNGTIRLTGFQRPLIYQSQLQTDAISKPENFQPQKVTLESIFAPLKFLFEKDVFVTLLFGAVVYTVWSMVTSSTTALFQGHYHLTDLQVGLVFLPNGAGCILGSYVTGNLMNYDYNRTEDEYRQSKGIAANTKLNKKSLADFPLERSRLRNIWWMVILFVISTSCYGFSTNLIEIPVPLILQFFIAYSATAIFSLNSALVIDLYPGASASATAVNNLIRCSLGAVGVGVVQPLIERFGAGLTFAALTALTVLLSPLLVLEWFYGEGWRTARLQRLEFEVNTKIDIK